MLNIVKMTNKTEALNIPEWKIDMSRNFIKRTIFADGFDDEFFQRLKEINSPAKSNAPSEEEGGWFKMFVNAHDVIFILYGRY